MSLRVLKIFALLLLLGMTQACGQKGSLYLPEEANSSLNYPSTLV